MFKQFLQISKDILGTVTIEQIFTQNINYVLFYYEKAHVVFDGYGDVMILCNIINLTR